MVDQKLLLNSGFCSGESRGGKNNVDLIDMVIN